MFGFEALLQFQEMILVDITEMYKEIRKERDNWEIEDLLPLFFFWLSVAFSWDLS